MKGGVNIVSLAKMPKVSIIMDLIKYGLAEAIPSDSVAKVQEMILKGTQISGPRVLGCKRKIHTLFKFHTREKGKPNARKILVNIG